ncbi:hypothetical protein COCON_G00086330, partial [Conger conger]
MCSHFGCLAFLVKLYSPPVPEASWPELVLSSAHREADSISCPCAASSALQGMTNGLCILADWGLHRLSRAGGMLSEPGEAPPASHPDSSRQQPYGRSAYMSRAE